MERRMFLMRMLAAAAGASAGRSFAATPAAPAAAPVTIEKVVKTEAEWRRILTPEQFSVLRQEGTEYAFTSPLNHEKRRGIFVCAGCELPLFESSTKYDSGTGWPSFYQSIGGRIETKIDTKLIYPRTEYHCVRCGGHQGHIFEDGPKPTGLRYCNNGVALKFQPVAA